MSAEDFAVVDSFVEWLAYVIQIIVQIFDKIKEALGLGEDDEDETSAE
ncbi:MAG: hypothetical protein LUG85_01380 [Clostridiales bacterium]|nr:hypothetical protein [Clostridiales bacterium]MCD7827177.1 hypothetical protein [Clostridiales bacterium]